MHVLFQGRAPAAHAVTRTDRIRNSRAARNKRSPSPNRSSASTIHSSQRRFQHQRARPNPNLGAARPNHFARLVGRYSQRDRHSRDAPRSRFHQSLGDRRSPPCQPFPDVRPSSTGHPSRARRHGTNLRRHDHRHARRDDLERTHYLRQRTVVTVRKRLTRRFSSRLTSSMHEQPLAILLHVMLVRKLTGSPAFQPCQ